MNMTRRKMLDAFYARDPHYDGRFVTGVSSTGIYCLPSCGARKPLTEHVSFFGTPEQAVTAGFRPCRRCRPDDFYRRYDPAREAFLALAVAVRQDPSAFGTIDDLASQNALGATTLNDLFQKYYHLSAGRFLTEARIARACQLLLETEKRVAEISLESGYASLSSFNANFRRRTGLIPSAYRDLRRKSSFTLIPPPDLQIASILGYQARDGESPSERIKGVVFYKALLLDEHPAVLEMARAKGAILCQVRAPESIGPSGMALAHRTACRLLGLHADPGPFETMCCRGGTSAKLIAGSRGLRIPQTADVFEGLTWAIIGQQINMSFAFQLRRGLIHLVGQPAGGGMIAHPTPAGVAGLDYGDLQKLKFSRRKAEYLIDTARLVATGELPLAALPGLPVPDVLAALEKVRGLGIWSSNYLGMRACGFSDCAPLGDTGLASGLQKLHALAGRPDAEAARILLEPYRPYRSFATFHLWRLAGGGA